MVTNGGDIGNLHAYAGSWLLRARKAREQGDGLKTLIKDDRDFGALYTQMMALANPWG